jgi:hypothetical protein
MLLTDAYLHPKRMLWVRIPTDRTCKCRIFIVTKVIESKIEGIFGQSLPNDRQQNIAVTAESDIGLMLGLKKETYFREENVCLINPALFDRAQDVGTCPEELWTQIKPLVETARILRRVRDFSVLRVTDFSRRSL